MSDDNVPVLRAIQDLRSDVIHELQEQRKLWGEAEATLLARTALHRSRLDGIDAKVESIEADAQDQEQEILKLRRRYHELANKLTPIVVDLEDVKERLSALELGARRDTELSPPPETDG